MGPERWAGQLIKLSDLNQREATLSQVQCFSCARSFRF